MSKNDWRRYRRFERDEFILIFGDTAWGGGDYCAAQFLSYQKLDVPQVYHSKTMATNMTPLLHEEAERIYDVTGVKPVLCLETNNGGVAELERLATLNRNGKYTLYIQKKNQGMMSGVRDSKRYGWTTTSATRPIMLSMLKEAVDNNLVTIYDRPTINEMFSFVEVQTSTAWKAQAESGAHDDLIMSLAGAWQLYQTERPPTPRRPLRKQRNWAHLQASKEGL